MAGVKIRPHAHAVVAAIVVALALAGCTGGGADTSKPTPTPDPAAGALVAAKAYLKAWSTAASTGEGDFSAAAAMTTNPAQASVSLGEVSAGLDATKAAFTPGAATITGPGQAQVSFTASWTITGVLKPWTYSGLLALTQGASASPASPSAAPTSSDWKVAWAASDIHPKLQDGQVLRADRQLPERASILDDQGKPLFVKTAVVDVGVEPSRVKDLPSLAHTLATVLKVNEQDIIDSVSKAKPNAFVDVITLREPDYEKVRDQIHDLPGTVFKSSDEMLAPTPDFARLLLGTVRPPTADVLKQMGPGYLATDSLGTYGLQAAYNKQLAGQAGATVYAVDEDAQSNQGAAVGGVDPVPGTPVRTTLDVPTQNAAEAALADVPQNASIVAIKPSTGQILAVANSPSTTYNIALAGQFPAGSTFKIITASALLEGKHVQPDADVPCPGQVTVYGKVIHNEDSFDLGTVSLKTAFAHSCNTTFAGLSTTLGASDLTKTAAQFGIGAGWALPVNSFSGSLPVAADDAEKGADAIGQGKVLVSPLAMALAAATVQHGSTPTPTLIAGQPAKAKQQPTAPPASVLDTVSSYMRAVVTEGTARGLRDVPGGPVSGKTGTAEYGTDNPPKAHAWFAGFQGDLAFAVFIEGGESSSQTAVPVAAKFLTALHASPGQ
jgi:cell division protein FtsI/penicillin-binding protein 2